MVKINQYHSFTIPAGIICMLMTDLYEYPVHGYFINKFEPHENQIMRVFNNVSDNSVNPERLLVGEGVVIGLSR